MTAETVEPLPRPSLLKRLMKALGLLIAAAALLAAGFGAGWFYFANPLSPSEDVFRLIDRRQADAGPPPLGGERSPRPAPEQTPFVTTYYAFEEPLTTNLADSRRFLQIGVSLSTRYDATVMDHVKKHKTALRSDMLAVIGGFTEKDIAGRAGREKLAAALRDAINERLESLEGFGGVEGVFFPSFVLQ